MSQYKTPHFQKIATSLVLVLVTITSFSCAKKASGVRGQVKKSEYLNMNPGVSAQAEQQASVQNAVYKIASISTPNMTDAGLTVDFEMLTPSNQYLPVTTHHENSLEAQGQYNDTQRGLQVIVSSRCSADDCSKYLLLITVTRNNTAVFQSAAVSYKDDCKFYSISVTNSFQTLDALDSYVRSNPNYATPRNDCAVTNTDGF